MLKRELVILDDWGELVSPSDIWKARDSSMIVALHNIG